MQKQMKVNLTIIGIVFSLLMFFQNCGYIVQPDQVNSSDRPDVLSSDTTNE